MADTRSTSDFGEESFKLIYQLLGKIRDKQDERLSLLLAMENYAKHKPRFRKLDQLNHIELEIFSALVAQGKFVEAENTLLTELRRDRDSEFPHNIGYPDLALFYANRNQLYKMEPLLIEAESRMNQRRTPIEARISINDAWCHYYRFKTPPDLDKARAKCLLGLEGAEKSFNGASITLHKNILKELDAAQSH